MKKDWILANVLIIVLGFSGILLSLKGYEEKDFLFHLSSAEMHTVKQDDLEIKYQVVEVDGVVPFNSINLSAFNVTSRFMLPIGATIWKANMVINKYSDGHITSGMAMQNATFFDSLSLDRHRNMTLPESLESPTTSPLDIINQIELQKVFYDLVMLGRFLYLMLFMAVCLMAGNLGIWFHSYQRRQKQALLDLIEEVMDTINSEPFKEFRRLANNEQLGNSPRGILSKEDWLLSNRVDGIGILLWKLKRKEISQKKFQQKLVELEFDTLFLQITVANMKISDRLDAIHYGNLRASYAGGQNEKPEQVTAVREVVHLWLPSTSGGISPRDKFNELKERIDGMFVRLSSTKTEDRAKLKAIKLIIPILKKLDELMVMINEEFNRSDGKVKLKRFDHVEKRVKATESSIEDLKLPVEQQS